MRHLHGILMLALLTVGLGSAAAQPGSVTLVTAPITGLTSCCDAPNKPNGPLIDVVDAAMKAAGLDYSIRLLPWARAIHMAKTSQHTCAVGLRKTPDNSHQYQWAGPLMRSPVRIWARQGTQIHINKEEHLTGRSIGVLRGSVYAGQLERIGAKVEQADSLASNIGKLVAGRIELMASSAKSPLGQGQAHPFIVEVYRMDIGDSFLACHRALDSSVVARLNDAILEARNAGALRQFGL